MKKTGSNHEKLRQKMFLKEIKMCVISELSPSQMKNKLKLWKLQLDWQTIMFNT